MNAYNKLYIVNILIFFHQPDSEEPFFKSSAFHEGMNFLKNGGKLLCLIGQWGSGKTSTAKQVYLSVSDPAIDPNIIRDPLTFNVGNQPVIFDDAISKEITEIEKDQLRDKIKTLYENMSCSGTKPFIIITLNKDMEHLYGFVKSLTPCTEYIKFINLSKKLTKGDRNQILHSQFESFCKNKEFSKVEQLALKGKDSSLGYPEICALFSRCRAFQNAGPVLFCNRPLQCLKKHLENMHKSEDNEKFLMLVYMSLNQMEIDVNISNDMLFEILRSCAFGTTNSNKNSITKKMLTKSTITELSDADMDMNYVTRPKTNDEDKEYMKTLLSKEFVVRKAGTTIYRLQHDVIKRMALIVFGTYHFNELLKFSKQDELKGFIRKEITLSFNHIKQGDIEPVLEIKKRHWKEHQAILSEILN